MRAFGDDADAIRAFATEVVAAMCRRLVDGGAPGLHFYTLNLAKPTQAVIASYKASLIDGTVFEDNEMIRAGVGQKTGLR